MKKLSFLIVAILFLNILLPKVQADEIGTSLGGIIKTNTVLTTDKSPYYLSKDLQLAEGKKLTIEEGVVIDGNGFSLTTWGNLEIKGTHDKVVKINNLHIGTGSQSYNSQELPPTIDIQFAHIKGGSLLKASGGSAKGNLILRDSVVKDTDQYHYTHIWYPSKDVYIERNTFYNAGKLDIGVSGTKVYVNNNVFFNNKSRTYYNDADIVNWNAGGSPDVILRYNSFLSPDGYSVKLAEGYRDTAIDAKENYWGTIDENEIDDKIFDKNDDLRAASYTEYQPYLKEPHKDTHQFTYLEIPQPILSTVYDHSTVIEGYIPIKIEEAKIIVRDWADEIIGIEENYNGESNFKVSIPKQSAESYLSVVVIDRFGNESQPYGLYVEDGTPPDAPIVKEITDKSVEVVGTTEPHSYVKARTSDSKLIGEAWADMYGDFIIPIEKQKVGAKISVTALDYMMNESKETVVIVQNSTLPSIPSFELITDQTVEVKGKADFNTTVFIANEAEDKIYNASTQSDGSFYIAIDKQKAESILYIFAEDALGNSSSKKEVIVKDVTAPDIPNVDDVSDQSETITGNAEADSIVQVKNDQKEIGKIAAKADGTFSLSIEKQIAGTKLSITATDKAGNQSIEKFIIVKDRTAPEKPQVNEVTDTSTNVTGKAEANSQVTVKAGAQKLGSATAKADRTFSIEIAKQQVGTKLTVTAEDAAGNKSGVVTLTVSDATAPKAPIVDEVTDQSTQLTGKAEADSIVQVKKGQTEIGKTTAKADGSFSLDIEKQTAGTKLSITATDKAGNLGAEKLVTVKDVTPPEKPQVNEVTDASTSVSGKAEAGTKVSVKFGTQEIASTTANADGTFTAVIEKQTAGTELHITATDKANLVSAEIVITVVDRTAPDAPVVDQVTDQSTVIKGKAEAGSKVEVKAGSTVLGSIKTATDGTFSLAIDKQKAATKLTVTATDAAGNKGAETVVIVTDVTAPVKPTVEKVTDQSVTIIGIAEANSIVTVKSDSKEIATAKAASDGKYSIAIDKQKAGTKLSIIATDKAGNMSEATNITVIDVTAPASPIVDKVVEKSTKVTGTAEAGSEIVVKAKSTILAQGKADLNGKFSLTIEPQVSGQELIITAIDAAGNISAETKITVAKAAPETTERISGSDRYTTAIAISKEGWKTADTVVLATAGDFPDALAGGPLAYQEDAPILLTRTKALNVETKEEIERLGAKKVIILGSKGAVSAEVETELKKMGLVTERLGGKTRFETAALIAGKMNSDQAIVANGLNFPDVLSVSSYAAKNGVPILLTRTDRLPDETKFALDGISSTYVIGSTGVVSKSVSDSLPKPTRFGGKDRYETGYEVATKLKLGTDKAYIATGSNFPDALAGSVLAAKNDAPILLVRPQQIPEATNKQLATYDGFSIFGGTGAVSDGVKDLLDVTLKNN
ncbi:hypothetical protein BBI11_13060 [Planococcus maritimus]|uniref:Ig-like domain-containing protein n=1 Tax=Planococcus maritimus TaxID=192421 RepID=UPI00080EF9A4|nr:Ig-like domain-containing protein [Planococcus maritimus]ANU17903.1 hypothetical protein BBI11_13060 [Planococcus maritimus]